MLDSEIVERTASVQQAVGPFFQTLRSTERSDVEKCVFSDEPTAWNRRQEPPFAKVWFEAHRPSRLHTQHTGDENNRAMKFSRHLVLVFACVLAGCDEGRPIVLQSQEFPSPDGAYTATLEQVDNGLGFGLGALYDEVHLRRRGEPVGAHGEPGRYVVFYAESTYQGKGSVRLSWLDSRHLLVEYAREQRPGRTTRTLSGVAIDFVPASP